MNTKVEKITEYNKEKVYDAVFSIQNEQDFNALALDLFRIHFNQNPVYKAFCKTLNISSEKINRVEDIPCLPVNIFRTKKVLLDGFQTDKYFESSGTSGSLQGKHYIPDFQLYERSFLSGFHHFYGQPKDFVFMALLPAYLERPH